MAAVLMMIGAVLGFFGGLTALLAFEATLVTALLIWLASGPAAATLTVFLRLVPQSNPDRSSAAVETA